MIFIGHLLLAFSGVLLAALGTSLVRNAFHWPGSDYSRRRTRTLGLALLFASILASVTAGTSFQAEMEIGSLPLTIGSGALWLLGAWLGHRFVRSESSVRHLSPATTTGVILWWVMRDGRLTAYEGFLLVGLGAWVLVSLGSELRGLAKRRGRGNPFDGRGCSG